MSPIRCAASCSSSKARSRRCRSLRCANHPINVKITSTRKPRAMAPLVSMLSECEEGGSADPVGEEGEKIIRVGESADGVMVVEC